MCFHFKRPCRRRSCAPSLYLSLNTHRQEMSLAPWGTEDNLTTFQQRIFSSLDQISSQCFARTIKVLLSTPLERIHTSTQLPDLNGAGRCTGSFPRPFLFIGDRHVFYLLLVCFYAFSVQIQPHHCVLEIF